MFKPASVTLFSSSYNQFWDKVVDSVTLAKRIDKEKRKMARKSKFCVGERERMEEQTGKEEHVERRHRKKNPEILLFFLYAQKCTHTHNA